MGFFSIRFVYLILFLSYGYCFVCFFVCFSFKSQVFHRQEQVFFCTWFHLPSNQLWPASLLLLKKIVSTTWYWHLHVSQWGWCCCPGAESLVLSHPTRSPSSTCLLFLQHDLWQTTNDFYIFLSTMTLFLSIFHKIQIYEIHD